MDTELAGRATYDVLCQPSGRGFTTTAGETVLEAALRAGLSLPHSCRNGVCGTCKARVVQGEVTARGAPAKALSDAEMAGGFALLCQAVPRTPLVIECDLVAAAAGIPVQRLVTRVQSLDLLAPDVMRIRLKLPATARMTFLAGQYINVVMNGGVRRSLSLANAPHDTDFLELHLRNYGGPFSTHVFNSMKLNDLLRVEGPMGTFFVREDSAKPIVLVASGTGFAPVKAMVEHQARQEVRRPMTLYWGGRRPRDLYLDGLAREWMHSLGVRYVPVVSEPLAQDNWSGRRGFVHRAVMEDFDDLSGHQVYACGAPIVVESARRDLTGERRLPANEFYADAFVPGIAPAGTAANAPANLSANARNPSP